MISWLSKYASMMICAHLRHLRLADPFFASFALFRGRIPSVPLDGTGLLYAGGRFATSPIEARCRAKKAHKYSEMFSEPFSLLISLS
jgi:hypothetical protein